MARATTRPKLTPRQRRLLKEIDALTRTMGLSADQVLSDWAGDSEGTTAHLTRIAEHLVRAEIIGQHTYLNQMLEMDLFRRIFRRSGITRRTRAGKTLQAILERLHPLQKLRIVRGYRTVPKRIVTSIEAINAVRNTAAHEFGLAFARRPRLKYKGLSLLTAGGIERLEADVREIEAFFAPGLAAIAARLRPPDDDPTGE